MYMLFRERFRALYGITLRVMLSEKVHEVLCTFVKNFAMHALSENDVA